MRQIYTHEDGLGLTELCRVFATDDPHPVNGANHEYLLRRWLTAQEASFHAPLDAVDCGTIRFQRGPRDVADSTPGISDGCLFSILIDRFEGFQRGSFDCVENDAVLGHLHAALDILKARARERAARGVLGKNEK